MEATEALEKTEEWIRVNLFGEERKTGKNSSKKMKEVDTFEDDDFFDRTLKNKKEQK